MAVLARLFATPLNAVLVLLASLAVAFAAIFPANTFQDKISNEAISFLPGDAESVAVAEALKRFPGGEQVPAVVVFRREGGLTAADRAAIAAQRRAVSQSPRVKGVPVTPLQTSPDGSAAVFIVPLKASGDANLLVDTVADIRAAVTKVPEGVSAKVTGPAGFSADAVKVFGNINTTLFLGAAVLVIVLLLLIYRSPIFWVLPILGVFLAEHLVRGAGSLMADAGVSINGQSQGIMLVLVFGAGTDYALLLVARYREELHHHRNRFTAMATAVRSAAPAILASAGTVIAGLLVLVLAQSNATAGLGPIGAVGVACAALSMLTFFPAVLVLCGRWIFWPRIPRAGEGDEVEDLATRGWWRRIGEATARHPRRVWVLTTAALLVLALGLTQFSGTLTQANGFTATTESVEGQQLLQEAFPAGASAPTTVLVPPGGDAAAVAAAARGVEGVATVLPPITGEPGTQVPVILRDDPLSTAAYASVDPLRQAVRAASPGTLVGGPTATDKDVQDASARDSRVLPPLILAVVFVILAVLLRSLLAPALLVITTVISYVAALGASVWFFEAVLDAPGEDPSLVLYGFVFLVALGVDYNIFLMARAREEAERHGTREGILRALAVTGGVITSAGIVLAGTFAILGLLPLWALLQLGVLVAFGVLLDALVVRTLLVPALVHDIGARVWWPSSLMKKE